MLLTLSYSLWVLLPHSVPLLRSDFVCLLMSAHVYFQGSSASVWSEENLTPTTLSYCCQRDVTIDFNAKFHWHRVSVLTASANFDACSSPNMPQGARNTETRSRVSECLLVSSGKVSSCCLTANKKDLYFGISQKDLCKVFKFLLLTVLRRAKGDYHSCQLRLGASSFLQYRDASAY